MSLYCTVSEIYRDVNRKSLIWLYPTLFSAPVGVTPLEFRWYFWHKKTRIPGLSYGVVRVLLRLAVSRFILYSSLFTISGRQMRRAFSRAHTSPPTSTFDLDLLEFNNFVPCFVCMCVCTVTDFSAEDKASDVIFCTAVRRRPRQGMAHFGKLCSTRSPKSTGESVSARTEL